MQNGFLSYMQVHHSSSHKGIKAKNRALQCNQYIFIDIG